MQVKGASFVSREQELVKAFGRKKWDAFIGRIAKVEPFFKRRIVATSSIPLEPFLYMQEELIRDFYNGEEVAYWALGENSGQWALTDGPYKIFMKTRDMRQFILSVPQKLWDTYYTEGSIDVKLDGRRIDIKIFSPIKHIYFEYVVMGYVYKALELIGAYPVEYKVIEGISTGSDNIHYVFHIQTSLDD